MLDKKISIEDIEKMLKKLKIGYRGERYLVLYDDKVWRKLPEEAKELAKKMGAVRIEKSHSPAFKTKRVYKLVCYMCKKGNYAKGNNRGAKERI